MITFASPLITASILRLPILIACLFTLLLLGCQSDSTDRTGVEVANTLFRSLSPERTGVSFRNELTITEEVNPYTYRNFYNGAGVGLGDFNNDGWLDIFFTGNRVENQLYWNNGDGSFSANEVAKGSDLSGPSSWSTGVTIVDINADGWDDIYVCKSGPPAEADITGLDGVRHNELFINQQDGSFLEMAAEYGLDFNGLGVHAAFFDYDQDGDLDCYLLSNSNRSVSGYDLVADARNIPDPEGGNRLLRCDWPATPNGQIRYLDVSAEAGIYRSAIGFGLGVTAGDVNLDGRTDLFVSNDYFERDYLYYNRGEGKLKEALVDQLPEISLGSMGADLADLDNDGLPELFVTEMLPATDERFKTKAAFQPWNRYQLYRDKGYHQQFSRNVLQWNRGEGRFSEVSRLAGVEATDWSWGALLFDMDGDGWKDIFVANGNGKDLIDQDYIKFDGNAEVIRKVLIEDGESILSLFEKIPSEKLVNGVFQNRGMLQFTDRAAAWGLGQPTFSNGAAYGDLDNDGDPDLVVSNIDDLALVYQNNTENNFIRLELVHEDTPNRKALGAKVYAYRGKDLQYFEVQPTRGFQSTTDHRIFIGLGTASQLDSLKVIWPDGRQNLITDFSAGQWQLKRRGPDGVATLTDSDGAATAASFTDHFATSLAIEEKIDIQFTVAEIAGVNAHQESEFIDFNQDDLLFWSISNEGPALAVSADRNYIYLGGAKGRAGQLLTYRNGRFAPVKKVDLEKRAGSEDTDAIFFDADGDGDQDLYVCSGGYEFGRTNTALLDALYLNENGNWTLSNQLLPNPSRPVSSSCVLAFDADEDGDQDLFVGGRNLPGQYGLPADSYLLMNDGSGKFSSRKISELGMVTTAVLAEGRVVVAGEFMPISILEFGPDGQVVSQEQIAGTSGLWYTLNSYTAGSEVYLFAGNHGLNSRIRATPEAPLVLVINDFDGNGDVEQILCRRTSTGAHLPLVRKDELVAQLPMLRKAMPRYADYAGKTLEAIFTPELLKRSVFQEAGQLATLQLRSLSRGGFQIDTLPLEAQLQPVYAIQATDLNQDGDPDILLGGNQRTVKPELGTFTAGFGQLLLSDGKGGYLTPGPSVSGLDIRGQIRAIRPFGPGRWLVARSDDSALIIKANK